MTDAHFSFTFVFKQALTIMGIKLGFTPWSLQYFENELGCSPMAQRFLNEVKTWRYRVSLSIFKI